MNRCTKCESFVPAKSTVCPNCSSKKSWWKAPLTILGAGLATVTLSACYGPPCSTGSIQLADGGTKTVTDRCGASIDCRPTSDGGRAASYSAAECESTSADAGKSDAGNPDGGTP